MKRWLIWLRGGRKKAIEQGTDLAEIMWARQID